MLKVLFLSKIYSACHLDVNRIKPGSNSIMTDKHTAEHSKTVCLGIYWPVCDVAHTTIAILISQINFHTSNDFCDWLLLYLIIGGPI